ncbi:MAG TPA: polysaccharide deacetylase family protein [Burkholderiaceae bacterium]|nr:polysaccharide deacetylase family protein [Burkholderiaceae bacterium]
MVKQMIKAMAAQRLGWQLSTPVRRPGAVVLMYHRVIGGDGAFVGVGKKQFGEQMRWLRQNCTPIEPEDLPAAARTANRSRPAVLVTFDDGYRDYHDHAYPILQELRIPAVMFLATDAIDRGVMIWTDVVQWAVGASPVDVATLPWRRERSFDLRQPAERLALVEQCKSRLKEVPDTVRRRELQQLLEELGVCGREHEAGRQMMNWDEVRACAPWTRFGGHSHTHPILSQLEPQAMEEEIRICRDRIEAETGKRPTMFAYPNGRAADFNDTTRALLGRHGFNLAFSTVQGVNDRSTDWLAIRRQHVGGRTIGDFAWLVGGH